MAACTIKPLLPGDETALNAVLQHHLESSMLLLSNSQVAGLSDQGKAFQGTYVGAFQGESITAVAAHYWNGNLVVQGNVGVEQAAQLATQESGRVLAGIIGLRALAKRVRKALGAEQRQTKLNDDDLLYALELKNLCIPELVTGGRVSWRNPTENAPDSSQTGEWSTA